MEDAVEELEKNQMKKEGVMKGGTRTFLLKKKSILFFCDGNTTMTRQNVRMSKRTKNLVGDL